MFDEIASAAAIVTASVGVGAFLDRYASDATKLKTWTNISGLKRERLVAASIDIVLAAYESIFGNSIISFKFLLRSIAVYGILFACLVLLVQAKSPLTGAEYISVFRVGTLADVVIFLTLVLIGGLTFWLANGQTLYFLRLARLDPRAISTVLIFYADILLTASIATVGVGFILWLQSAIYLAGPARTVTIDLRVRSAESSFNEDLARDAQTYPEGWAGRLSREIESRGGTGRNLANLESKVSPSSAATRGALLELDLLTRSPPAGLTPVRSRKDLVQFLDSSGDIFGYSSLEELLQTKWVDSYNDKLSIERICGEIHKFARPSHASYVRPTDFSNGDGNMSKCLRGEVLSLTATASLNGANVNYGHIFIAHTEDAFNEVLSASSPSSIVAGGSHPLYILTHDFRAWRHFHLQSESNKSIAGELDTTLLNAFLVEAGAHSKLLTMTVPTRIIIILILGTSVFTIALLVGAFAAAGIAMLGRGIGSLQGPFLVDKHPFVFVFLAAGIGLALLRLLIM